MLVTLNGKVRTELHSHKDMLPWTSLQDVLISTFSPRKTPNSSSSSSSREGVRESALTAATVLCFPVCLYLVRHCVSLSVSLTYKSRIVLKIFASINCTLLTPPVFTHLCLQQHQLYFDCLPVLTYVYNSCTGGDPNTCLYCTCKKTAEVVRESINCTCLPACLYLVRFPCLYLTYKNKWSFPMSTTVICFSKFVNYSKIFVDVGDSPLD